MPSVRTLVVGGGLLALVLGGYWYFNGRGDSGADRRGNAAPVRVAVVEQRDMAVVERSLGSGGRQYPGAAECPRAGDAESAPTSRKAVRQEGRVAVPRLIPGPSRRRWPRQKRSIAAIRRS